jgi:hypothetical protein
MATIRVTAKNGCAINPFKPSRAASAAGRKTVSDRTCESNFSFAARAPGKIRAERTELEGAREEIGESRIKLKPCYAAVEKFSPTDGSVWGKYIHWSGLSQLTELISLDGCLCKPVLKEFITEDFEHISEESHLSGFFKDLDYLRKRLHGKTGIQILAVLCEPVSDADGLLNDDKFEFFGYDLLEDKTGISAITNCGGFDKAFANSELSAFGLIQNLARAKEIQKSLKINYPEEAHAQTAIWALWRMKS